ncbi:MAG: CDF family Co(II)/Ni(II) efflux transporter DmeF [Sinobacteraceae bacterium]|nr:CDF family Co(II)/Ni(II) efflux transporter DmeF [Nevskiaceae bacterium]
MESIDKAPVTAGHGHIFLGSRHEEFERKTWGVIALCSLMMVAEIVGGALFGSLALIADGLHMSTHAGAMLIAALAYTYARRHADDPRFSFGTGKLGDLAGFTSAIVLALIAVLIAYEAIARLLSPVAIAFAEAIPIAALGLVVNIVSAWMLSGTDHGHDHGPSQHAHTHSAHGPGHEAHGAHEGHDHHVLAAAAHQDNSIRSAYIHVVADAAVSVVAIVGLLLARTYGWLFMDPIAGIIGALVIASWAYRLMRDTSLILLDVCPDDRTRERLRSAIECDGDQVVDLHMWRVGPGHLAAVVEVATVSSRDAAYYRSQLRHFPALSHVTVEVTRIADLP